MVDLLNDMEDTVMEAILEERPVKRRFTAHRRDQLVQMVQASGYLSVNDAAKALDVSAETIRKDIISLDKEGLLQRSRGGALPVSEVHESPLNQKINNARPEKSVIADHVASVIPGGSSLILDAGSTTYAAAVALSHMSGLTIFTNSITAIEALSQSDNEVFVLGGHVRKNSQALVGDWPLSQLLTVQADIGLIGADGVGSPAGPTINSYEEVAIKRGIIKAAQRRILLADKTKFAHVGSFKFCTWDDIDLLVTNEGADTQAIKGLVNVEFA